MRLALFTALLFLTPLAHAYRPFSRTPPVQRGYEGMSEGDTVEEVINGHPELLGNPEYNYAEFLWKLRMAPERGRPPYAALNDDEAVSIIAYTSKLSLELNRRLRNREPLEEFSVIVEKINSGLKKLPPYTGWVYRSTHPLPQAQEILHQPGQLVRYLSFTSTSLTGYHDALFGQEHFKIYSVSGRDISPLSIYFQRDSEREVLFPSGTDFEILRPTTSDAFGLKVLKEVRTARSGCGLKEVSLSP